MSDPIDICPTCAHNFGASFRKYLSDRGNIAYVVKVIEGLEAE